MKVVIDRVGAQGVCVPRTTHSHAYAWYDLRSLVFLMQSYYLICCGQNGARRRTIQPSTYRSPLSLDYTTRLRLISFSAASLTSLQKLDFTRAPVKRTTPSRAFTP